jgi:hypothetical protein
MLWIRIGFNAEAESRILMTKNLKILQLKKKIFLIKNCYLFIPIGLHKGHSAYREAFSSEKRTSSTSNKMKRPANDLHTRQLDYD